MSKILLLLTSLPVPVWLRFAIIIAILMILFEAISWYLISRLILFYRLKKILSTPEKAYSLFFSRYNKKWILSKSDIIEKFAKIYGEKILYDIDIDDLWIERLVSRRMKKDFKRVLKYSFDKGAFACFLVTLKKNGFAGILLKHLKEKNELFPLRRLSLSCNGEDFDRKKAYELYKEIIPEIRELSYDVEWKARYFSLSLMLFDFNEKSIQALWEGFSDPSSSVRKIIIKEFNHSDKKKIYENLISILLNDPVFEIRKSACERIRKDFNELYHINSEGLNEDQVFHLLELLDETSKEDENFALFNLNSSNLEIRLNAALFLDKVKALERICLENDLGDMELFNRNYLLLKNAVEVNVTDFFNCIKKSENKASLLLISKLIVEKGDNKVINDLAKKVFRVYKKSDLSDELYINTVSSITQRGNEAAQRLLKKELWKNRYDPEKTRIILPRINNNNANLFFDILMKFLIDEKYDFNNLLIESLLKVSEYFLLPEIIGILKDKNKSFSDRIKTRVLMILQKLNVSYGLQTVLENYNLYSNSEAAKYSQVLSEFPKDTLISKLDKLLSLNDSRLKSSLIASLASIKEKSLVKYVRENLNDPDPDIRISCIMSIINFNEMSLLEDVFNLLSDPTERVRYEAAKAIACFGKKSLLYKLKIYSEEEESDLVKKAIIYGLGESTGIESISILTEKLEKENSLEKEIIQGLIKKNEKKEIIELINNFKKGNTELKEKMIKVFVEMGEDIVNMLVEILKENNPNLKPFIVEVLERTNFLNLLIKKLRHRNPIVRKEIIELLMLISSKISYRAILLASKDPDPVVRTFVIKALEKLSSHKGKEFLDELRNDPDKKVKLYAEWAFEKLKAKELI